MFSKFLTHSRELHGMPCASGDCVLTTVEGIQNLISYLHITSCPYQNVCQPFELKGVRCSRTDCLNTKSPSCTNLSMQNVSYERLANESELESDSNKIECINDKNSGSVQTQSKLPREEESMLPRARDLERAKRKNESPRQREKRLAKQKSYRKSESFDAREKRLAGQRLKRKNEPLEAREKRLTTRRFNRENESQEVTEKKLALKRSKRKNESSEAREKRLLARARSKRKNESPEAREKRLTRQRSYRKSVKETKEVSNSINSNSQVGSPRFDDIAKLIRNFHNSVSAGPLYVCTCCEQLWYKHSVYPADKMKLTNPESAKYLQNVKSVDNVEWICNTCRSHLQKRKIPPTAVANGMKFPTKPDFFDLNELECGIVAPRLSISKNL